MNIVQKSSVGEAEKAVAKLIRLVLEIKEIFRGGPSEGSSLRA